MPGLKTTDGRSGRSSVAGRERLIVTEVILFEAAIIA
jgi:hypothetical protein